jgi:3-hexulose-6-phosphate synthase/6-phospho-3-hexuloisomerase
MVQSTTQTLPVKEKLLDVPPVQIALDLMNIDRAIEIAQEAVAGGVTWIEAGTPLIKSEGMNAVRKLRKAFPSLTIVADMKTVDAGSVEIEMAARAGADVVLMLGVSDDSSIREAVLAGKKYGVKVGADLIDVRDPVNRAVELEKLGIDIICSHVGLDQQVLGVQPIDVVAKVAEACSPNVIIAAAGGLNSETAVAAYEAGARLIIVGGALYKSPSPEKTARNIIKALKTGEAVITKDFVKYDENHLHEAFMKVSTCNISDAMHKKGEMRGLKPVWTGNAKKPLKFAGQAVTCRTYSGDWSKPVESIDHAKPGNVIVIDSCESEIACWGELATNSCISQQISAVIIDGAARDIDDIRKLEFPVFSRHFSPTAGENRGLGEIGVAIECAGQHVEPGDWIIGDESGVVVVPKKMAMEMANRAIDVKEKEDRVREEIRRGSTLAKVLRLKKWDKVVG